MLETLIDLKEGSKGIIFLVELCIKLYCRSRTTASLAAYISRKTIPHLLRTLIKETDPKVRSLCTSDCPQLSYQVVCYVLADGLSFQ